MPCNNFASTYAIRIINYYTQTHWDKYTVKLSKQTDGNFIQLLWLVRKIHIVVICERSTHLKLVFYLTKDDIYFYLLLFQYLSMLLQTFPTYYILKYSTLIIILYGPEYLFSFPVLCIKMYPRELKICFERILRLF